MADGTYDSRCYDYASCGQYSATVVATGQDIPVGNNPGISVKFEVQWCSPGYGTDDSKNCVACPPGQYSTGISGCWGCGQVRAVL